MQNQKRYWLRGGVVGLLGGLFIFWVKVTAIMPPVCYYHGGWEEIGKRCSIWEYAFRYDGWKIVLITIAFVFFGWLYGKIKNRKIANNV